MPRSGRRRTILPNIYQDASRIAIVVRAGAKTKEYRVPLGTPKARLLELYAQYYRQLVEQEPTAQPTGTLARDIARYLTLVKHLAGLDSVRAHLKAWIVPLGTELRRSITREDILRVRSEWSADGVKPKTINNRVSALRALFETLDGEDAITPLDKVKPLPVHRTPAVSVHVTTILDVDRQLQLHEAKGWLRNQKTRARFRVLASTGKRPSELMRAEPSDVDLRRRVWTVRDGKGGFSPGIYLTDDMVAAWELFIEANAWGSFNTGSFARRLRQAGWPAGVRPYNLRHSIGIALSEAGIDLADVQQVLGHKHIATTRRHYVPVRDSRMQRASTSLEGRLPWPIVAPRKARKRQATK